MELSSGGPNASKLTRGAGRNSHSPLLLCSADAEIIDISKINFEDDENWLCSTKSSDGTDLQDWIRNEPDSNITQSAMDFQKNIDTRTFTRPKKRFSRPSLDQYNEFYASSSETVTLGPDSRGAIAEEPSDGDRPKAKFDLSLPSSPFYFKNLATDAMIDSFMNASPPSLANSLCSSTFANLMESSVIKNDPILRGIRDADYSNFILDSETPMIQSLESISSENADSFWKKISYNNNSITSDSFMKKKDEKGSNEKPGVIAERTFVMENEEVNQTYNNPNGTYRRTPKHNTFRLHDVQRGPKLTETTFDALLSNNDDKHINKTRRIINDVDKLEDMKKDLSRSLELHTDLNRLSYCMENDLKLNDVNKANNLNDSVMNSSAGSADSLDRLSSLSGSSRESNKMPNIIDVDAIVKRQEKHLNLNCVMSTPKPSAGGPRMSWGDKFMSPIVDGKSDSDLSSSDDYKSVKSSQDDRLKHQQPKTMNFIKVANTKLKTGHQSTYTGSITKPMAAIRSPTKSPKANCYSNLRGSIVPSVHKLSKPRPSSVVASNLKAMGTTLKGSYTSLRPISTNLPEAPPLVGNVQPISISRAAQPNVTRTLEPLDDKAASKEHLGVDETFVKPLPKPSYLPRPSSIPRPATGSRIPAPRSGNLRQIPARTSYSSKRLTKMLTQ
ncbi:unnamed protein product [Phyllotreta striolata]|uniref:Uncharacterized protein n=1 Tax=Phyllotreta striolata TaxID=444603 RepID=A0A9N9TKJ7_PHYSR|nr:unnamed protein product [Phyllotreta striolata]